MSTQTINNQSSEPLSQGLSGKGAKTDSALASSLSVMTLSTNQLLESLGISPEEGHSVDDSATLLMLNEERQKIDEEQDKEHAFIAQLASDAAADGVKGGTTPPPSGKNAIFEAAADMSKIQSSANSSIVKELKRQLQMMKTQLTNLEREATFWDGFGHLWGQFSKDPSNANLQKLLAELEKYFPNDSDLEKWAKEANKEQGKENQYDHRSGWLRFWHGQWSDPHYYKNFEKGIKGSLDGLISQVESGFGVTNSQFQNEMQTGQTLFQDHLQKIMTEISVLSLLISVLEGGQKGGMSLVFQMESILMSLEQLAIGNNTKKQQQQSDIAKITISNLTRNLDNMIEQMKKATSSHGLFGWIEDFFKSIIKIFENIGSVLEDVFSGNMKKAGEDLLKATGIETIIKAFQKGIKQGLESLITAVIFVCLLGPAGMMFMNTSFGKDMNDVTKLVVDAVVALGEAIVGGLEKAFGDDKGAKTLLDKAKKLGEEMLANPALKALADVAMVVIIIAAVISQQYWLAGLMLVLFVASETGLMQKATTAIENEIAKIPGLSKATAQVLADALVIIIVTALSFGAGSAAAAGDVAADEAVQTGEEIADNVVENTTEETASQTTSNTTDNVANQAEQKSKSILEKIGEKVGKRAGTTMVGGGSVLGSSSFGIDLAKVIDKKSEALEIILALIQEVLAAAMAMIGGLGVITSAPGMIEQQTTKLAGKLAPKLVQSLQDNAGAMAQLGGKMQVAGTAVAGVSGAMRGGNTIIEGMIQKILAELRGDITLLESTEQSNNDAIKNTSTELNSLMKEFETIVNNMDAPALAGQGVARALMQNA